MEHDYYSFTCNGCGHRPSPEYGLARLVDRKTVEFKCPKCGRVTRLELETDPLYETSVEKEDGKWRR